ncbi:MAG TPA: type II CAAX endopeptidase family protein [Lacipirellulaceae bacterium]|nr:type II CAAX endopeptidase family protein [Lacipirellulaceae bacterium]
MLPAKSQFAGIRRTSWLVLASTIVVYACATLVVNWVLFQGKIGQSLGSLYSATGFLIRSTLVGGLFTLLVIGTLVIAVGRLRCSDVGWAAREFRLGLLVTFGFWLAMNVVLAAIGALGDGVVLNQSWRQPEATALVGSLIGQLLGNALAEETIFRGFLLPQLYLKTARSFRPGIALAIAVVGSSLLFSLSHVPNRLFVHGLTGSELIGDQAGLFLLGVFIAGVYIVTQNLFVVVGLHALVNEPALIIGTSNEDWIYAVWGALAVLLLLAWSVTAAMRNRA